ncbi:MAG: hypothetical protein QOE70_4415 [Chthoniobacter sp.]|jgi:hypothetical protein|nr:hypothetical protein [Chthoniobacter sp.]
MPISRLLLALPGAVLLVCSSAAEPASANPEPFPTPASKKGLQVEMLDDALALGIKHAALNCNLGQLIEPAPGPGSVRWQSSEGREFTFNAGYLEALDRKIKPLSEARVVVYLILLNYVPQDPAKRTILVHPGYNEGCPNHVAAFNTATAEGIAWLRGTAEFLAARYSRPDAAHGRVWGWIVGNEVQSHWYWYNLGRANVEEVADAYEKAVRIVHDAVRTASQHGRVYLSLDHHWTWRFDPNAPGMTTGGKMLLDEFARIARERGDFDWHLAQHPYSEDLRDPRFWNDLSATDDFDSPRLTYQNLEVLTRYLARPGLLHRGEPRRVILSEQGFNFRADWPTGELVQAAAWCAAWRKVVRLDGIDAFILHRHVDHAQEGGLLLGLWTFKPGTISTPDRQRRMYEPFRLADTPEWERAFAFALPIIGWKSWDEGLRQSSAAGTP